MAEPKQSKIKCHVYLERETVERLDELAGLLNGTRASIAAFCVEETIRDKGWIMAHIAAPMRRVLGKWGITPTSFADDDDESPADVKGVPHAG